MQVPRPHAQRLAFLALAWLATVARASAVASDADNSTAPAFAEIAVQGLRDFGRGIFEVVAVVPGEERNETHVDGQKYQRHLRIVELAATVRYTAEVMVPTRHELRAAVGGSGWTLEQSLIDLDRLLTLGPGLRAAGSTQELHVQAALGRRQAGWYFHSVEAIGPRERPKGPQR